MVKQVTTVNKSNNPEDPNFPYEICLPWSGKDGYGNRVDLSNVFISGFYYQGIYHFPVYDAEFNDDGFTVATVRPDLGVQELFFDDTQIPSLNFTGENKDDVLINNKNGKLKIKMNLEETFDGNKTRVKLYYSSVDIIDVNEGAKVFSDDKIKQFEIDLRAQEGGKINVKLNVTYVNIKSVTGGVIKTAGKAKSQDISLLTGGVYKGGELKTDKTEVTIRAAGEAYVNASDVVDIKIRAGGDVFIYGDPETVNESRVFGGRVKRME